MEHPTNAAAASLRREDTENVFEVETAKVSGYINNEGVKRVNLVKIDVEGAAINVVRDLESVLPKIEIIILEIHSEHLTAEEKTEMYEILSTGGEMSSLAGGRITSVDEFQNTSQGEEVIWRNTSSNA